MKDLLLDLRRILAPLFIGGGVAAHLLTRYIFNAPAAGDYAVRVRRALEALGLTYIKLGQFLAMRYDILPAELCGELNRLFEDVAPMSFAEARAVVEAELRGPLHEFFPEFDAQPIASASVAQVHAARLASGARVAVKVQRPGVTAVFRSDVRNLRRISRLLDAFGVLGENSLLAVVKEFEHWTLRELDFEVEGRTADRLRRNAIPQEIVPVIYWELTTSKLLVMEFIEGVSLAQVTRVMEEHGLAAVYERFPTLDLELALHNLAFASMHQLFVVGFFHGDPHPGNILIAPDNAAAFVDFGIFGEQPAPQREILASYLETLAAGRIDEAFRLFARLATPTEETDFRAFADEVKATLRRWYQALSDPDTMMEERHSGRYSYEIFESVRRHGLRMSADTLLFWRALTSLDSTALRLSSHFDLLGEVREFFRLSRPDPVERALALVADGSRTLRAAELSLDMNGQLTTILRRLAQAKTSLSADAAESATTRAFENRLTRLLAGSLLAVALAVASTSAHLGSAFSPLLLLMAVVLLLLTVPAIGAVLRLRPK